MTTDLITV